MGGDPALKRRAIVESSLRDLCERSSQGSLMEFLAYRGGPQPMFSAAPCSPGDAPLVLRDEGGEVEVPGKD